MKIVSTTDELRSICQHLAKASYVTVDTEFLRESTFWPELCLIQCATPIKNGGDAYIIDPLAKGIDLQPFFELMANEEVVKVFHAARQDIEIIYKLGNLIPKPVFDTQIAAMVCGYGDSVSYDQLVFKITGATVDKSSRFTDWKRRPLTDKQLNYAIADVTHLREVYSKLKANLEEQDRAEWVSEELDVLTSVETYDMPPENAWPNATMRAPFRSIAKTAPVLRTFAIWLGFSVRTATGSQSDALAENGAPHQLLQFQDKGRSIRAAENLPYRAEYDHQDENSRSTRHWP